MAAIDPSAPPQLDGHPEGAAPRATLKLIRASMSDDSDSSEDEDDLEALKARIVSASDLDSDESDPGPSDPSKAMKARMEANLKALEDSIHDADMETEDGAGAANGVKSDKGKAKAVDDESGESSDEDDDVEEFVVCTLDPAGACQQPLDITISQYEEVFFTVNGTHTVFLTGSYLAADDNYESDDGEGDLTEDDLESYLGPDDDGLDDLGTPRIAEIGSDEDAPQLLQLKAGKPTNKGKNKRPANFDDEDAGTLDNIITKALAPEAPDGQKLSKKQLKKLKKNDGQAGAAAQEAKEAPKTSDKNGSKDSSTKKENGSKDSTKDSGADKKDKKVQFAKNLEQGPTGSPKPLGTQNVQGVAVDDKKVGKGPAAKKGDKVEMRYIGKLADGKVFDSNKKGKPFSFKLGAGQVIKGWDIGVAGITAGGERRITIPAKLAYGNKAQPGIPANSSLVFDIKCLAVN